MTANKFRLLFFGTDAFSVRVLDYLLQRKLCQTVQVVTKSRSALEEFSSKNKLKSHEWPDKFAAIDKESFNVGLVASFGNLIDENTVKQFHYGLFNVHPSLLPMYRGSTPIQAAILDGLRETGCTIMQIPPIAKFDVGQIILQKRLKIEEGEYAIDLRNRLADLGSVLVEKLLLDYEQCMCNSRPQQDGNRSYAKKLKPEQGQLNFKSESSQFIDRKIRAYTGFIELFMFCLNGIQVRLDSMVDPKEVERYDLERLAKNTMFISEHNVERDEEAPEIGGRGFSLEGPASAGRGISHSVPKGAMYFHKIRRLLCIKCADSKWLAFREATPKLKAKMSAADFYNGYLSKMDVTKRTTDS